MAELQFETPPLYNQELTSTVRDLPHSCLEMKTNMLSVDGNGERETQVTMKTLYGARERHSPSWCWGLAKDLFHRDP